MMIDAIEIFLVGAAVGSIVTIALGSFWAGRDLAECSRRFNETEKRHVAAIEELERLVEDKKACD